MADNRSVTLLASAARTASNNTADQSNNSYRGVHVIVDVTAVASTPSVVVTIQGKDEVSGVYYDLLVATAITTTGTTVLKVYPGIAASAGGAAPDVLPSTWRVKFTHADTDSITYSAAAQLVI